jgi:lipoprotein-releasing system ATP-binding protein
MIKATDIKKSYGSLLVLKGIDFEAKEAEVVSIVGASGAGKSSLLQILGTLSRPDTGRVLIDGTDLFSLGSNALADFRNKKIGFVFQFHHLLPEFTAQENVAIPALIGKESSSKANQRAAELLRSLGLGGRLSHKPSELSGGEQQRVAIARALMNNPSVILADEPSGNLDTETKRDIHGLFFELREKYGQTIIIVTHDRDLAAMSDRIMEMKDGSFLL